jgi:Ca2+-binding EF-hand superfamily protein
MGNFLARPLLEALDSNKDGKVTKDEFIAGARQFFKDCDKDERGSIDEQAITDGLNRLFPQPPGFGPPGGGPGGPGGPRGGGPGGPGRVPGGPGGFEGPRFGPGAMLASAIARRADKDKDGKVTLDKFVAAAEALFKECDKDRNGSLDEKEITAGIELLFPVPRGFGPPRGRPEEPKKDDKKEEKKP